MDLENERKPIRPLKSSQGNGRASENTGMFPESDVKKCIVRIH